MENQIFCDHPVFSERGLELITFWRAFMPNSIKKKNSTKLRLLNVLSTITIAKSKRRKLDVEKDIQMQIINSDISVGIALEKLR